MTNEKFHTTNQAHHSVDLWFVAGRQATLRAWHPATLHAPFLFQDWCAVATSGFIHLIRRLNRLKADLNFFKAELFKADCVCAYTRRMFGLIVSFRCHFGKKNDLYLTIFFNLERWFFSRCSAQTGRVKKMEILRSAMRLVKPVFGLWRSLR